MSTTIADTKLASVLETFERWRLECDLAYADFLERIRKGVIPC